MIVYLLSIPRLLIRMDRTVHFEDVFDPERWEALRPHQSDLIRQLRDLSNKLIVLQSSKEVEAIDDMLLIIARIDQTCRVVLGLQDPIPRGVLHSVA